MKILKGLLVAALVAAPLAARAEVTELQVPLGAGGFGFLPLHMMKEHGLVEKHAKEAGLDVTVNWANIGGPSGMNDALLSGSAHFISAGPPAFLTLWDRTRDNVRVMGVAAMSTMPMYLNTKAERLKSIDDIAGTDKIGVTAVKVSIPSIVMQMYAAEKHGEKEAFRFDPFTVSMTHPDGVIALLSDSGNIAAHYTSPPFHHMEIKDAAVRTIQTSDEVMGGATTFTMISTTTRFKEENPKVYAAFVEALKEANGMIADDPEGSAEVLLKSMGGRGWEIPELVEILNDPDISYQTEPQNVMKYARFMHSIGSLRNEPAAISDLFFDIEAGS